MTHKRNYYEILQVSRYAEQEIIDAAYRRLAQKYHPDKNPSPYANRKMQEINEAYEVLSDYVRRAEYDKETNFNNVSTPPAEDIEEIKRRAYEEEQKRKEAESARQKVEKEKESIKRYAEEERIRRQKAEKELRQTHSLRNINSMKIYSTIGILIAGGVIITLLVVAAIASSKSSKLTNTFILTQTSASMVTNTITYRVSESTQTISTNTPPQASPTLSEPHSDQQMGNIVKGAADDMAMILIPEGDFLMGSSNSDTQAKPDEKPQHIVYLDAYYIDQTEVTNAMFAHFVQRTGYRTTAERSGSGWVYFPSTKKWQETPGADWRHPFGPSSTLNGRDAHPVVQVSWDDALAYCSWVGGRLPTEAEWEKAARGTDGRIYPWGNQQPDCSLANYWGKDNGCVGDTTQVGNYSAGASPYGLMDMAGNVLEWVQDWYSETYYIGMPSRNPVGPSSGQYHVLRGGAWDNAVDDPRSAMRNRLNPDNRDIDFGFRCAKSP